MEFSSIMLLLYIECSSVLIVSNINWYHLDIFLPQILEKMQLLYLLYRGNSQGHILKYASLKKSVDL